MRWIAVVCLVFAAGLAGFAGGRATAPEKTAPAAAHAPAVYCYDPHPGPHLNADGPPEQVCVPTGR